MTDRATFRWPDGAEGAVSLTYDDALRCHHGEVAPLLEAHGLRGTFNTDIRGNFMRDVDAWRAVAARGHELGNHSLFHPCRGDERDRPWLPPAHDLRYYTPQRWTDEMRMANFILQLVDGRTERTFANTCCDNVIGQGDEVQCLEPLIEELFVAARGQGKPTAVDPAAPNFSNLGLFSGDGRTADELVEQIRQAVSAGRWAIYMFHGVGEGTHKLFIDADEHRKLVGYLGGNRGRIWTTPMIDAAKHLRSHAI